MKRVLAGVLAIVVLAIAGFFGFQAYVQHRAATEVEAAFAQIRGSGAKASHGKVTFDPWTRALTVADIAGESSSTPPITVKVGTLTATGLHQMDARFSADSIEADGIEIGAQLPASGTSHIAYKLPRIVAKDVSGPVRIASSVSAPAAASSLIDTYRHMLEQSMGVAISSLTAPSLSASIDLPAPLQGSGDYTYSGLVFEGIKDGKIKSFKADDLTFRINLPQSGKGNAYTGHVVGLAASDFDASAVAAILDPDKANDDRTYRAYGHLTMGPYDVAFDQGMRMRIDGFSIDDIGFQPSRLQLPALLAAMPQPGTVLQPAQARAFMDKLGGLYAGLHVGNAELHGVSAETPQGPMKLGSVRLNLTDGKVDFSVEGLDGRSPQGPVRLGRFALKSFDIAHLMRLSAQFTDSFNRPAPAQALEFLKVIEGIELKDFSAPYKTSNKPVKVDNVNLSWGQFIGPIPTQAHLVAKLAGPIDASNPALLPLLAAGIDTAAIDADVGAGWTESSGAFALSPVRIELSNLLTLSAGLSLAHVPRELFTSDARQAISAAAQIETGTFELTLRDLGIVDLLVAQYARAHNLPRDAARQAIIDSVKAAGEQANANPDAPAAVEAIVRFIETPRQTLTLKLTPRAKVPTMQLLDLLRTEPSLAAAQFRVEASTGL